MTAAPLWYSAAILYGLLDKPVYQGTVPAKVKAKRRAKRRAKNKMARRSRAIGRKRS